MPERSDIAMFHEIDLYFEIWIQMSKNKVFTCDLSILMEHQRLFLVVLL